VLQKQYRPPVDKTVIELPAGLIDEGETAEQAAVRELREETGYVSEVLETSPVMFNGPSPTVRPSALRPPPNLSVDPGFTNTNLCMVHVTVDMSLPENQNLKPELEENEFIEVFLVKLADLWNECIRLEAEGYAIDARIANLAEGTEIAKKFKL
jgi:ADP-ribose pyrophosphatase